MLTAQEKTITLHENNIPLEKVFIHLEEQTDYTIAYDQINIHPNRLISVSLNNATIDKALHEILKETELTYKIKGYHIIISPLTEEERIAASTTQKPTQTIRGIVTDTKSGVPIQYASIGLVDYPSVGTTTNSAGHFQLPHIPVGRYNIKVTYVGYETRLIPEVLVTSAKEVNLLVRLTENIHQLSEVVVYPVMKKEETLNQMALTGGRMINMEEAARFANGFDDPARLVTAFAGIAGDIGTNALVIRGNSPLFTQWKLEGVEIPNPNHFADVSGLGGGFLSALSTHVIGNSDFYNGAFPAEYHNAISGVFDMYMRNGNNQKYEHTVQVGLMGVDVASEGPINKQKGSSYLFNYRFSDLNVVNVEDVNLKYHDLSFKLNFPTRKAGTFSVWGFALTDRNIAEIKDTSEWETQFDRQYTKLKLNKVAGGVSHKYILNSTLSVKTSLDATYSHEKTYAEQYKPDMQSIPVDHTKDARWDIVLTSYLNKRFSSKHINRTGFTLTGLKYDINYMGSPDYGLDKPMEQISKGEGRSAMLSAFSSSVIDLSDKFSAGIGLTGQYFTLNNNISLEPRLALKWKVNPKHSLAIAYGLNSRREKLDYYFVRSRNENDERSNKQLNFSKAHHFGITYNWNISPYIHFKAEPYYQSLFDIPVEENTSFSILNHRNYLMNKLLINNGKGRNYGIDLTLERYLNRGYYYMFTTSLFKSKYRGGDNIWRPTQTDRIYILNALGGKEWMIGKQKQNMLNLNIRLSLQGGERYTPVDEEKSHAVHDIVLDKTKAFSKRFSPFFISDLSASYKLNKKNLSHEFSIKYLNLTGYTGAHFYEYNEKYNQIKKIRGYGMIPNISYWIQF